jgi:acyl-CoA hydrolase
MADIPEVNAEPPGEVEMKIGQLLADIIPDGATLQVGIGSIPNAVLSCLTNHRNLGVHSEMISDGIMHLIKYVTSSDLCNFVMSDRVQSQTLKSGF